MSGGAPASHLDGDEHKGDDELGGRADELGRGHRPLPLLKDAVDAVGFGQHGGIGDGHAEAQHKAAERTHHHAWLGDHQERYKVDQEDTCQPVVEFILSFIKATPEVSLTNLSAAHS